MVIHLPRPESAYDRVSQQVMGAAREMAGHAFRMILNYHGMLDKDRLLVDKSKLGHIQRSIPNGSRVILFFDGHQLGQYDLECMWGLGSMIHQVANIGFTPLPDYVRAVTIN